MSRSQLRRRCLTAVLGACLALTGCAGRVQPAAGSVTLPPVAAPYPAPTGQEALTAERQVALYLPSRDGQRLIARTAALTVPRDASGAREAVQALLSAPADEETRSLGGGVALTLYGRSPVEKCGDICTVSLSPSALELDFAQLYTVGLALASTLQGVCGVQRVNLLVADLPIGFDVAGYLPAGGIAPAAGEELNTLWSRLDARHAQPGQSAANVPVSAVATLYFPLADGSGMAAEARSVSAPGQTASQLAAALVDALSVGAMRIPGAAVMPDLNQLLLSAPEVSELADGGRIVSLRFQDGIDTALAASGVDSTCFLAALNATLTTFIPQLGAVRVFFGNEMLTALSDEGRLGFLSFEYGVQRRRQLIPLLRDRVEVLLSDGGGLVPAQRYVPAEAAGLKGVFTALIAGADARETAAGLHSPIPAGLDETDLLGWAVADDCLLVNLSPRFERLIRVTELDERELCYSLVNTLCGAVGLRRIRFFFEGAALDSLGGDICWSGVFFRQETP